MIAFARTPGALFRIGFVVAFMGVGLWGRFTVSGFLHVGERSTLASVDSFLASALGVPHGSERLLPLLKAPELRGNFVFFCYTGGASEWLVARSLAYLAWPRKVDVVILPHTNPLAAYARALEAKPGGLFFYRLPVPPSLRGGATIGNQLVFFPQP